MHRNILIVNAFYILDIVKSYQFDQTQIQKKRQFYLDQEIRIETTLCSH